MNCPCELYGLKTEGRGWGEWSFRILEWPDSAGYSMLPHDLYRQLPIPSSQIAYGNGFSEVMYADAIAAFLALVEAFGKATWTRRKGFQRIYYGPQWVPDWSLAAKVPDDTR